MLLSLITLIFNKVQTLDFLEVSLCPHYCYCCFLIIRISLMLQIRSHAQKYFLKVQKSGTGEHLPPPRPKRKAAHPYPQKAHKNGSY